MDTVIIAALSIIALVIVGVLIVWYGKREAGSIGVDIEVPGIKTSVKAETKETELRSEQAQIETEGSEQEQPRGVNARQFQKKTKNSKQRIT